MHLKRQPSLKFKRIVHSPTADFCFNFCADLKEKNRNKNWKKILSFDKFYRSKFTAETANPPRNWPEVSNKYTCRKVIYLIFLGGNGGWHWWSRRYWWPGIVAGARTGKTSVRKACNRQKKRRWEKLTKQLILLSHFANKAIADLLLHDFSKWSLPCWQMCVMEF